MAEVEVELRRRRLSGELPGTLERELDGSLEHFAALVPPSGMHPPGGQSDAALEHVVAIDVAVPLGGQGRRRDVAQRMLRPAMAWYLNYVAQQLRAFGLVTARSLRLVGDRISLLEDRSPAVPDDLGPAGIGPGPQVADVGPWLEPVVSRLAGTGGRVLHAECGSGRMLGALVAAGVDAYGVDPRPGPVGLATAAGLDAWAEPPLAHLARIGPGRLAGLVLSGLVDRLSLAGQRRLTVLAATALAPGGHLVLLGTHPRHWSRGQPAIVADLAAGRPLHAETWRHLLAEQGFQALDTLAMDTVASPAELPAVPASPSFAVLGARAR